jgi:outer membrane biosynthesis protein TonB
METTKIIRLAFLVLVVICISSLSSFAKEPAITPAQHIQNVIKQGMTYPEQAVKSCCTGKVDVIFTVDDEGKITIEKTMAENANLERMVKEQLSQICCKGLKTPYNEHYKITISFKLIG